MVQHADLIDRIATNFDRIGDVLQARGDRVKAGDIASRFACSWPTTTRHLRVLEQAHLVSVEKQGRERVYALQRKYLTDVVGRWLKSFE